MKLLALTTILALSTAALAQSFNIDINANASPPPLGGGVPSSAFGGAAGTPGFWNRVSSVSMSNVTLSDLAGAPTSARIIGPVGGSGGGNNIPINTGDYALLLNDARSVFLVGNGLEFKFTGLQSGRYEVYTYAVSITTLTDLRRTRVTIGEAIGPASLISKGPMPGNALIEGVTHTRHEVLVANGEINVLMESLETDTVTYFNGIQVKQVVPEPATILSSLAGLIVFAYRGGKNRQRGPRMR